MSALHTPSPCPPLARPASTTPAAAGDARPTSAGAAALDPQVVEDRLRALFRLSTRRGLIHPLHHVMLRLRKEGRPAGSPGEGQS